MTLTFKSNKSVLVTLIVALGFINPAQAQFVSDYQINRNYDRDFAQVLELVKTIQSSEEAASLVVMVEELENKYKPHETLLNAILYPSSLNTEVQLLKDLASVTQDRIRLISDRGNNIADLNNRISDLSQMLAESEAKSDSLQNLLTRTQRARDALNRMVRDLQSRVNSRDEFIIDLVNNSFEYYQNLNLTSLSAGEKQELVLNADADNVLGYIKSVIDGNISFIDTNTQLSATEFLILKSSQVEFTNSWSDLGTGLAELYSESSVRQEEINQIAIGLRTWSERLDESVWKSVSAAFNQKGVELSGFNSPATFYTSINNYLDSAITSVQENGVSESEISKYEAFKAIWTNDVKLYWQEHLIHSNILSFENIATIDNKLSDWNVLIQPVSKIWTILFFIALIVVAALAYLYLNKKK